MRVTTAVCAFGLLWLAGTGSATPPVHAQSNPSESGALGRDMESIKRDLAEIKKSLSEIRQLFLQRPAGTAPAAARLSVGDGPSLGRADAPVTVVEFSDYQCPFCQRFFNATLPALKKDYVDSGKIRYVFRDFPLDAIHPQARKAAEAAHCAGEQGKYWEMHDTLFKNQRGLNVESLKHLAGTLGLRQDDFDGCLEQGKYAGTVSAHHAAGASVGVTGTPSFFIGATRPDGTLEATRLRGAQPVTAFREVIDRLLGETKQ